MRTFLASLLVMLFSFGVAVPYTEAAKFGGGSSFGKKYSAPKKVQPAAAPTQQRTAPAAAPTATPKKSGFGGLMGGLLAGGLLGALFFGGAFDGIQAMDLILIAVFAFIAYKLFAMFKNNAQTAAPKYAGFPPAQEQPANEERVKPQAFTPMSAATTQFDEAELVIPQWFNKVAFLSGARDHFTNLQAAWDRQDWDEIGSYTSAEMLAELQQERARHPAEQTTDVVSVMSELINFIDNQDHVVASIHFYGWIKETADQQPTEFSEIWHLSRDMSVENADWFIVGIEQPS
jgi:predicted lipid-binding transport protein (Tim44 family)